MDGSLDRRQKEAVLSEARYTLVVAGPGSGKTRVLASRYARLTALGSGPEDILALTFTNRAAGEMRSRVASVTGLAAPALTNIGTFHAFALRLIKDRMRASGKTGPAFVVCGRAEGMRLLRGLGVKNPGKTASRISAFKNLLPDRDASGQSNPAGFEQAGLNPEVFALYEKGLREEGAIDLDDLVTEAIRALEGGGARPAFSNVLVDEFQDINPAQALLTQRLLAGCNASLLAIGDPDQSIYAFRGANVKGFMDFTSDYPGALVVELENNYRSTAVIVGASNALIGKNVRRVGKTVRPVRTGGEPIHVIGCESERAEAGFIISEIERLMGGLTSLTAAAGHSYRFSDFAVLARTRRLTAAVCEAFKRSSIPYQPVGLPDGMDGLIDRLKRVDADECRRATLVDIVKKAAEAEGLEQGACLMLAAMARELECAMPGASLSDLVGSFTESMILMQPSDTARVEADRVLIMTLHMAKGLEFPVVFIAGCEDGLMPLVKRAGGDRSAGTDAIEEERRLFYVGLTRAMDRAYLLHSRKRRLWGAALEAERSPFIDELPAKYVKEITLKARKIRKRPVQKGLFD